MSVTYGFYDSLNGDRKYNTTQISEIFDGVINDGIFMSQGTAMVVKASSGMIVNVGIGRAYFNHTWTKNDAILPLTVEQSEALLNRIDAVVLEVNASVSSRINSIKIIKGTPSSTPVKPTMADTETLHQHPLCYITVNAGVTNITQAVIQNMIGTSTTPYVTGILETVGIDDLLAQWETQWNLFMTGTEQDTAAWESAQRASFDVWFANVQDTLDENTAGNLLNLINGLQDTKLNIHSGNIADVDLAFTPGIYNLTAETLHVPVSLVVNTYGNLYVTTANNLPFDPSTGYGWCNQVYYNISGTTLTRSRNNQQPWTPWEMKASGNGSVWSADTVTQHATTRHALIATVPNFIFTDGCQVTMKLPVLDKTTIASTTGWLIVVPGENSFPSGYRLVMGGSTDADVLIRDDLMVIK